MSLTVALIVIALGSTLIYKGWRGLDWPGLYREIATEGKS